MPRLSGEPARRFSSGLLRIGVEPTVVLTLAALLAGIFFFRILRGPGVLAGNDLVWIVWPFRAFVERSLAAHQMPLWVPGVWMGAPFAADNDAGLFYPLQVPYLILRPQTATAWVVWLHAALSVATMYAYARLALRVGPPAAFGAGVVFAFNGYAVTHTGLSWSAYEAPWPPLLFLAVHRAIDGEPAWAWLGPVAVALALLGGQAQNMYWSGVWLVPYAAVVAAARPARTTRLLQAGIVLGATVVAGVALAAVQVLPEAELLANGVRLGRGLTFAEATLGPLQWSRPWRLLLPGPYIGEGAAWIGVVGALTVGFGVLAAFWRRRSRAQVTFLVAMASACFVLALGAQTPVYRVVYELVPGMHQLRLPVRWLYPMTLALSALVALGLDELQQSFPSGADRRLAALACLGGLALGLAGLIASPVGHGLRAGWSHGRDFAVGSLLALAVAVMAAAVTMALRLPRATAGGGLILALAFELLVAAQSIEFSHPNPVDYTTPRPIPAYVAAHGPGRLLDVTEAADWQDAPSTGGGNVMLLTTGSSVLGLSSSWPTQRNLPLERDLVPALHDGATPPSGRHALLRALGVRYIVAQRGHPGLIQDPEFEPRLIDGQYQLFELRDAGQRAWTSCGARLQPDASHALAAVMAPDFTLDQLYIEGGGTGGTSHPCGTADIIGDRMDSVTIRAKLPDDGWLVLSDSWYPGWQASVDGRPAEIRHADYFLRGVAVPVGAHTVRFDYRPASFSAGLILSVGATASWLASLLAFLLWRGRRLGAAGGGAAPAGR